VAFPTTSLLDDFNRADTTLNTGNWGQLDFVGPGLSLISNQCGSASNFRASYWTTSFAADQEAFCTIQTVGSSGLILFLRLVSPLAQASTSAYAVYADFGGSLLQLYRLDPVNSYHLLASTSVTWGAGDKVGGQIVGSALSAWRAPAAGSWTQVVSATDATYSSGGVIGIEHENAATRSDDFSGGSYVAAATLAPVPARRPDRGLILR